jgi:Zn-finger nucleic acid-binding protein
LVLERKWFSESKKVEIDQCTRCGGIWLDAGEFSHIYDEIKGSAGKVTTPLWAVAMAEAAKVVGETPAAPDSPPHA